MKHVDPKLCNDYIFEKYRKEERTSLDGIALIAMGVIALFFTPFVKFAAYGAIIYGAYTVIKSEW